MGALNPFYKKGLSESGSLPIDGRNKTDVFYFRQPSFPKASPRKNEAAPRNFKKSMFVSPPEIVDAIDQLPQEQVACLRDLIANARGVATEPRSTKLTEEAKQLYDIWWKNPWTHLIFDQELLRHDIAPAPKLAAPPSGVDVAPRNWAERLLAVLAPALAIPDQAVLGIQMFQMTTPAANPTAAELARLLVQNEGAKGANFPDSLRKMAVKSAHPLIEELPKVAPKAKTYRLTDAGRERLAVLEQVYHRMMTLASPGTPT